jgi:Icc protein
VDDVLLTGDVTHRGRASELALFADLFSPLRGRLVTVPGNHDRLGDDVARQIMSGPRVQVERRPDLLTIRLDSTAPHNRKLLCSHGDLTEEDVESVLRATEGARPGTLVVIMLHHHLHRLPEDHLGERLVTLLGWPNASELARGRELLERLRGRCDLVVHGHRHVTGELHLPARAGRPLRVLNAGCTPELGRARIVAHAGGRVAGESWLEIAARRRPRALARAAA